MNYCNKLILLLCFICPVIVLECINIPLQIDWRSSLQYSFFKLADTESSGWEEMYKLKVGIDTLFTNGIRTRLALTNQDSRLLSQALFEYALIEYQCSNSLIQIALKDHGYGKGFRLYNRRYDDNLYDKSALTTYRWQGISFSEALGEHSLSIGIAGNELNRFLSAMSYELKAYQTEIDVFGCYVHHDSDYTINMLLGGYELRTYLSKFSLHSAFEFKHYPDSQHFGQMQSWHLINELSYQPLDRIKFTASLDLRTEPKDNHIRDLSEFDFHLTGKTISADLGFRTQSLPGERADTYFLDVSFEPVKSLKLGVFVDFSVPTESAGYTQVGIQTGYKLK